MDRNEIIKKYARSDEEKLLLARICDLASAAQKQWRCVFSEFLTPAEQALIGRVTELNREVESAFFGGFDGAERKILALWPDAYTAPAPEEVPIDVVEIEIRFAEITHRDILGSLMGLQIQRNRVGDILDTLEKPAFLCLRSMTPFILENLTKIGRNGVKLSLGEIKAPPEQRYSEIRATVASLRLDSILAECFGLSRTKAADLVRSGIAQLNWEPADDVSREIREGDRLSLRGYGKAIVAEVGGESRKGRRYVTLHRLK